MLKMGLVLSLRARRDSFGLPEMLMRAALKLLRPLLDAQVIPDHVAHRAYKCDDQKDIHYPS